ncbi:8-hydroxygeraniol dehydrogenase [Sesamum angolense]|uniref:8-hydroxygeraniol dehydrogenase n=1 Tax=Sesamum angolense TaxID=2727404 RepID=A0AAE1WI90_9LAMI|nr:8-hydroxygeraniol dehydrogenase [Sesamum angolense]
MATSPETEHPVKAFGWAAKDTSGIFSPFKFSRRATGEHDVQLRILYCGVCHSDLHMAKNELGFTQFPMVPGHEIVGIVTEVGSKVKKCKVGDRVDPHLQYAYYDGTITQGGYSDIMVADEHFVILWPDNFPLDAGAPLLCAGVTTYSPLRHFGLDKPGTSVGVVGLGGLGHLAVKFAKAFGVGPDRHIGWYHRHGLCNSFPIYGSKFVEAGREAYLGRRAIIGSATGGLKETQEMIDFAAKHNILPDVEMIPMDYVNTAMERLFKSDVKYRFVIDIANTLKAE